MAMAVVSSHVECFSSRIGNVKMCFQYKNVYITFLYDIEIIKKIRKGWKIIFIRIVNGINKSTKIENLRKVK
jgi:hypothetical protein